MTNYQSRCHDMFVRVSAFGESLGHLLPAESSGARAVAVVSSVAAEISALRIKEVQAVDHPQERARARAAITRFLQRVAQAARYIARLDRRKDQTFVVPSPRTDVVLLTTARRFLRDAQPIEARFIDVGMPPTFMADLRETTDAFERAVRRQRDARRESVAVRAGYRDAFRRGFDAVLSLDVVMASLPRGGMDVDVAVATWKIARRVERPGRRRRRSPERSK